MKYDEVEEFLELHNNWFTTPTNDYYGQAHLCRNYLNYRMEHGNYGEDYGMPILIMLDRKFDEWLDILEREKQCSQK